MTCDIAALSIAALFDDATDPTVHDLFAAIEAGPFPWSLPDVDNLVIDFESGWQVSIGFGTGHYCTNKFSFLGPHEDLRAAITIEVAIFKPDTTPYFPEGFQSDGTGGWIRIAHVAHIIDCIAGK